MYTPLYLSGGPTGAPNLYVYMVEKSWNGDPSTSGFTEQGSIAGMGYAARVSADLMTTVTQQPSSATSTEGGSGGFYPPTFWFSSQTPKQWQCSGGVVDGPLYVPFNN